MFAHRLLILSPLSGGINPSGTYLVFAIAGFLTLIYCITNIPENKGVPLEKCDQLFGVTTWSAYAQFVWDNIRYNGKKHLRDMQKVTLEHAKEVHALVVNNDKGE